MRVLFVGNSFTSENELPGLVQQLAAADAGSGPIFAVGYTAGGATLRRWARDDGLTALLGEIRWDVVVLQEQSQILSFSAERRRRESVPFARALHARIASAGARTILFMTWGYESGDLANVPGDSYSAMQARLAQGYAALAADISAPLAPVGLAWAQARRRDPTLELWQGDGRHPNRAGSYLAACVFYSMLTGRNPAASRFTAGLGTSEARFLQGVAADIVPPPRA